MGQKLRIEGIYDQRTLKHLKGFGLKDFSFDFSPRSFNFIQEYVFLEQLLSMIDSKDRVFLHFSRSNDPMVAKLILDIKISGHNLSNVYFEFDEWAPEITPNNFQYNYLLNYGKDFNSSKDLGPNFRGFLFNFDFFEELHAKNILNSFATNFYTRFHSQISNDYLMLLRIDWHHNLISSLFDLFEFNLISIPINSKIEICYRNVDLKKLNNEMEILQKNNFLFQDI